MTQAPPAPSAPDISVPWRAESSGLSVSVRLTPRGGRDSIDGVAVLADGRPVLLARVRPPPEDGAANHALEKLLARQVGIAGSRVRIVSGQTSRVKTVHLAGDAPAIARALSATIREKASE